MPGGGASDLYRMMERNRLGSTVIVRCDTIGCGTCWVYDAPVATFAKARERAAANGWECISDGDVRSDTCRWCVAKRTAAPATGREGEAQRDEEKREAVERSLFPASLLTR